MMTTKEADKRSKGLKGAKGLYIHIPFCVKRCSYCDFLTFSGMGEKDVSDYVDALIDHIKSFRGRGRKVGDGEAVVGKADGDKAANYVVDTVYIGGGSPSFIDGKHIAGIMDEVGKNFSILGGGLAEPVAESTELAELEITLEANPESITAKKLETYRRAGINRLSIGAQSMDDGLLKVLGRAHDKAMFVDKYKAARKHGFKNISVDLIFALPGQTMEIWKESLKEVLALEPEHISFYALQIEDGTLMKECIDSGRLTAVDEEADRAMYHEALKIFKENGYEHYEISNCAKPGFQSRHNLKYWSMEEYIGLGLGAHSYYEGVRYENIGDLKAYGAGKGSDNGAGDFVKKVHKNTLEDEMVEYMFTGLRKVEGISKEGFKARFGKEPKEIFGKAIEKNVKAGLLEEDKGYLKLSSKGMDLFNQVLVDFV